MNGWNSAITEYAILAGVVWPHYAQIREAARIVQSKALEEEQKGKIRNGADYRLDLLKFSNLMRVQSRNCIGNLVGVACMSISISRTDNLHYVEDKSISPSEKLKRNTRLFIQQLQQTGHDAQVPSVRNDLVTMMNVKSITDRALRDPNHYSSQLITTEADWLVGYYTLTNIACLCMLSLITSILLYVWRKRQTNLALYSYYPIVSAFLFMLSILITMYAANDASGYTPLCSLIFIVLLGLSLLVFILPFIILRGKYYRILPSMGISAATSLIIIGMLFTCMIFSRGNVHLLNIIGEIKDTPDASTITSLLFYGLLSSVSVMIISVVRQLIQKRKPLLPDIVGDINRLAIVFVFFGLFYYMETVMMIADNEQKSHATISSVINHEGRYSASLLNETWPE